MPTPIGGSSIKSIATDIAGLAAATTIGPAIDAGMTVASLREWCRDRADILDVVKVDGIAPGRYRFNKLCRGWR